jgi:hypothetical protein
MPEGAMAKKKVEKQLNTYQGMPLDLTDISKELTEKARRFIYWFAAPYSDAFLSKKNAAIAAGYASRNAASSGYKLCRNPKVAEEIEKLSKRFNAETIDALHRRYINSLEAQAFYDPADFVDEGKFKDLSEIAPEKRVCLDQPIINSKGDVMGFTFGNRRAAIAEIKELHKKFHPDTGGMDEEETREIIMERIRIKEKRRSRLPPELEGEIVEGPAETEDDDDEYNDDDE